MFTALLLFIFFHSFSQTKILWTYQNNMQLLVPDTFVYYYLTGLNFEHDTDALHFEDLFLKDNENLLALTSFRVTKGYETRGDCSVDDTFGWPVMRYGNISLFNTNSLNKKDIYLPVVNQYLSPDKNFSLWCGKNNIKTSANWMYGPTSKCISTFGIFNKTFFQDSLIKNSHSITYCYGGNSDNSIQKLNDVVFSENKILNIGETHKVYSNNWYVVSIFHNIDSAYYPVEFNYDYFFHPRNDSMHPRGYMYFWGNYDEFDFWTIDEDNAWCTNRLAWHHDTFSFIEAWNLDTAVSASSPYRCTHTTQLRKMTFDGKLLWQKDLPVKLHYLDHYKDKSPFMANRMSFYLIDNYSTGSTRTGPYYNTFKLYKFDSSGYMLYSKKLDIQADSCGRLSWPIVDCFGNIYTVFENIHKKPAKPWKEYKIYQLDSLGNVLWKSKLPRGYDWWGSRHMALSEDNYLYLGSSKRDTIYYLKIGEADRGILSQTNDTTACEGQAIKLYVKTKDGYTYQWAKDNTLLPGETSPVLQINNAKLQDSGLYSCIITYCRIVDTSAGIKVTVLPKFNEVDKRICNTGAFSFGGKLLDKPGTYTDTFISSIGCDSIVALHLDILQDALPDDTFFCQGGSVILDAKNNGASYKWSNGKSTQTIEATKGGLYKVAISTDSCKVEDSTYVTELPLPVVSMGEDREHCFNSESLWLEAGTYTRYKWEPGGLETEKIEITQGGVYSLTVWDEHNCRNTGTVKITENCHSQVFIPTAFTPNKDGLNDMFLPVVYEIQGMEMQIYNRWGQKLFESSSMEEGWDGTYKGTPCPMENYYYHITIVTGNGEKESFTGLVALVR